MSASGRVSGSIFAGRFQLEKKLGSGGSAIIWEATELAKQRKVAIKLLDPRLGGTAAGLRQFKREGDVLAELDHPNIARAYELGIDGEQPFLVMELVDGVSLDRLLAEHAELDRPFATTEIAVLFGQLAAAVGHAHSRGIMHRDLKPANLMLEHRSGTFHVKVIDFGLAKLFEENAGSEGTTRGRRLGSIAYMAPEQARGEPVGPRADIFSMGVILVELLTLRRPFLRDEDGRPLRAYAETVRHNQYNAPPNLMARMAGEARPKCSVLRPGLDVRLDELAARALAADPAERFESAGAMEAAFEAIVPELELGATEQVDRTLAIEVEQLLTNHAALAATRTVQKPQPLEKKRRPRVRPWMIAAPIAAVVLLVAAILSTNEPDRAVPIVLQEPPAEAPPKPTATRMTEPSEREVPEPEPEPIAAKAKPTAPKRREDPPPAQVAPAKTRRSFAAERTRLKDLTDNAGSTSSWIALGESIAKAAEELRDPRAKARIQRLARSSAALGDADGVDQALSELEKTFEAQR